MYPTNIYSLITPMYYICKILGLAPFKISKESFKPSKVNVLWTILVICSVSAFAVNTFVFDPISSLYDKGERRHYIEEITDILEAYCSCITMIVCLISSAIHRNELIKVINKISDFDKIFASNQIDAHYKTSCRNIFLAMCAIYSCFVTMVVFEVFNFGREESPSQLVMYILPNLVTNHVVLQFCVLLLIVRRRFKILNDYYEERCDYWNQLKCGEKRSTKRILTPKEYINENLERNTEFIRRSHYDLCNISQILNSAFSPQIMFILVQSLITTVSILFYFSSETVSDLSNFSVHLLLYTICVVFINSSQIVTIVLVCVVTNKEANRTSKIMFRKQFHILRSKEFEHEIYFSTQLLHQNVQMELCPGFPVTGKLLSSVLGSIATYLLIVIQFEIGASSFELWKSTYNNN